MLGKRCRITACKKSGHYEKQDESQVIRNLRMVGCHATLCTVSAKQSPGQRMFTVGVCKRSQGPRARRQWLSFGYMPGLDDLEVIGAKSNGYGTQNRYPRTDPQCKKERNPPKRDKKGTMRVLPLIPGFDRCS